MPQKSIYFILNSFLFLFSFLAVLFRWKLECTLAKLLRIKRKTLQIKMYGEQNRREQLYRQHSTHAYIYKLCGTPEAVKPLIDADPNNNKKRASEREMEQSVAAATAAAALSHNHRITDSAVYVTVSFHGVICLPPPPLLLLLLLLLLLSFTVLFVDFFLRLFSGRLSSFFSFHLSLRSFSVCTFLF